MTTNMTFLNRMMHSLTDALEHSAQNRTRQYLLGLSDQYLDDLGLSRELLKQGPAAWPWRKAGVSLAETGTPAATDKPDADAQPGYLDRIHPAFDQPAQADRTDTKMAA